MIFGGFAARVYADTVTELCEHSSPATTMRCTPPTPLATWQSSNEVTGGENLFTVAPA